jgi:hypothetical protein
VTFTYLGHFLDFEKCPPFPKKGQKRQKKGASMVTKAEYLDSIAIRWLWSIPFLVIDPLNF